MKTCSYLGCHAAHVARGYCGFHLDRLRDGRPMDGPRPRNCKQAPPALVRMTESAEVLGVAYRVLTPADCRYLRERYARRGGRPNYSPLEEDDGCAESQSRAG